MEPTIHANEHKFIAIVSAFIGVHPRLNLRSLLGGR